ncbi:MAG: site-2 protease family protein [Pirellulales bacterium]|nr:site-2 protease family protein [Pirellulales bacterium]
MLDRRLKLGTFFGIELYVHWTFALLVGFFAYQSSSQGVASMFFSIAVLLSVFFCVTLHEYGHALAARRFGIPTVDITLLPIGGVARLQHMPRVPWQELVVAVAGPAVNVVIALLIAIGFWIAGGVDKFIETPELLTSSEQSRPLFSTPTFGNYFFYMMIINAALVVFNMIPAFPMDGGRVFRSLLAMTMNYRKATVLASRVGLVCAALMAGFALSTETPSLIPVLIAIFVAFAGIAEARQVEVLERVRGLTVRRAMVRGLRVLPMDMPLDQIAQQWTTTQATVLPVVSLPGTVVGMLRLEDVCQALRENVDRSTTAGQLVHHLESDETIGIDEDMESVVLRMGHRGRQLAVVDHFGQLVGILDLDSMVMRDQLAAGLPAADIPHDRFDAFS